MTPFYDLALKLFTRTQKNQIQKGMEKYPEPFNPRSWTPNELLNHALEETVDLTHYLVGLKALLDDKDEEIKHLKHQLALVQGELSARKMNEISRDRNPITTEEWMKIQELKERFSKHKPPYADLDD